MGAGHETIQGQLGMPFATCNTKYPRIPNGYQLWIFNQAGHTLLPRKPSVCCTLPLIHYQSKSLPLSNMLPSVCPALCLLVTVIILLVVLASLNRGAHWPFLSGFTEAYTDRPNNCGIFRWFHMLTKLKLTSFYIKHNNLCSPHSTAIWPLKKK